MIIQMIYQMKINVIFIQNSVLMIIGNMIGMNIVIEEDANSY